MDGDEEKEQQLNQRCSVAGEHAEGKQAFPPSPCHRLLDRRAYWGATMRQMGLFCALTFSILTGGFCMDWVGPRDGLSSTRFLRNHPSALV